MANRNAEQVPFKAEGAIANYRFVKGGTAQDTCVQAAGPLDFVLGVCEHGPAIGEHSSYDKTGYVFVEGGAAVAINAEVTSDASGRAVTAVAGNRVHGIAKRAVATAGDLLEIELTIGAGAKV